MVVVFVAVAAGVAEAVVFVVVVVGEIVVVADVPAAVAGATAAVVRIGSVAADHDYYLLRTDAGQGLYLLACRRCPSQHFPVRHELHAQNDCGPDWQFADGTTGRGWVAHDAPA